MNSSRIAVGSFAALLLVALGSSALAASRTLHSYTEDFSTREFCDSAWTTADWATSVGSLDNFFQMRVAGEWDSPGSAVGVNVDGDHAFLADGASGLQILDVTNPAAPVLLGNFDTPGTANDVDIEDNHAYVADGAGGLRAVDISNPAAPGAAGFYDTPGTAGAVDVDGDLAYVADGSWGLQVIDVRDPRALVSAGSVATAGPAYDVDVEGDYAYVAIYDRGLAVIDISNPARPVVVGSIDTPGRCTGVAVDGDWAYLADGVNGLVVVDVSNPAAPLIAATLHTPDLARGVAVDGEWAYVADTAGGVHAVDIDNPLAPALYQSCNPPASARAIVLDGLRAYVADYTSGLRVLDLGVPLTVLHGHNCGLTTYFISDLTVAGDHLFAANSYDGLVIFDISDRERPAVIASCETGFGASGVDVSGDYAYVAYPQYGLQVVDISDPASPVPVGHYPDATCSRVVVNGDYAYTNADQGLTVIDIGDPADPALVGHLDMPDVGGIAVDGNRAYIGQGYAGLSVVDITNPAAPILLGNVLTGSAISAICASGDHVYGASHYGGMQVIDVRDPGSPVLVATFDTPDAHDLVVAGDLVYLADEGSCFQVIDVSDPLHPAAVADFNPGGATIGRCVTAAGDHVFLAGEGGGSKCVEPIDVSLRVPMGAPVYARSLPLNERRDTILKVKATTTEWGRLDWQFTAGDTASAWLPLAPDGLWHDLTTPGDQLVWRCTLYSGSPDPACTDLAVSWLYTSAIIDSVRDMPGDQGGWLRIAFQRSGHDFAGDPAIIAGYNIWRRMDDYEMRARLEREAVPGDRPGTMRTPDGRVYAVPPGAQLLGFPPGMWEVVGSFSPLQQQRYFVTVPSRGDSTPEAVPYSIYVVTAHTVDPATWYVSQADSAYSLDNMAPSVPGGLRFAGAGLLGWDACPEGDFDYFTLYGSTVDSLESSAVAIGYTIGTRFDVTAHPYAYYHVTATDFAGNQSEEASIGGTTDVPTGGSAPVAWSLRSVQPNPGQGRMDVWYDVPRLGEVRLDIFDVKGRAVTTLVDATMPAGRHRVIWEAEAGSSHASPGIYFVHMRAPGYSERRKVVLLP